MSTGRTVNREWELKVESNVDQSEGCKSRGKGWESRHSSVFIGKWEAKGVMRFRTRVDKAPVTGSGLIVWSRVFFFCSTGLRELLLHMQTPMYYYRLMSGTRILTVRP